MHELIVQGKSASALSRGVSSGKYIRVCQGLYVHRKPQPRELLDVVLQHFEGAVATGRTAVELYLGNEVTFPLELAHERRLPSSEYFTGIRTQRVERIYVKKVPVHVPCLAIEHVDNDAQAIKVLERAYSKRQGHKLLEKDNKGRRLSVRVRELIAQAAVAADSGPERKLIRALKERGLKVENNVKMGAYYWDIFLPQLNVIVEVDGYSVHRAEMRTDFIKDRWKGNDAVLAGYVFLRFTDTCILWELPRVVDMIMEAGRMPRTLPDEGVWTWHRGMRQVEYPEWTYPQDWSG